MLTSQVLALTEPSSAEEVEYCLYHATLSGLSVAVLHVFFRHELTDPRLVVVVGEIMSRVIDVRPNVAFLIPRSQLRSPEATAWMRGVFASTRLADRCAVVGWDSCNQSGRFYVVNSRDERFPVGSFIASTELQYGRMVFRQARVAGESMLYG